jgi:hypothetical protein
LPELKGLDVRFYQSYNVIEYRGDDPYVRELKLEAL